MAGTHDLSENEITILEIAQENNEWYGAVGSPTGAFARVTLSKEMREQIVVEQQYDIGEELIGFWIVIEDEQGFVYVTKYPDEATIKNAFENLGQRFAEFADEAGWDE